MHLTFFSGVFGVVRLRPVARRWAEVGHDFRMVYYADPGTRDVSLSAGEPARSGFAQGFDFRLWKSFGG